MDSLNLIRDLSNAYGVPGFEDEVLDVIEKYKGDLSFKRDSMMNCYLNLDKKDPNKPTIMLDAHLDEVGFMVQSINHKGLINFIPLGGWVAHDVPAHLVAIKNSEGKYIKGIITSKPPHFLTEAERNKKIELSDLQIDVGATTREEVIRDFKIEIGAPIIPLVDFEYNEINQIMMGKAFDDRLGCAAVIEVLKGLQNFELPINVVGTLTAQEEVGTRGAEIAARVVEPDIAIIFEGSPADDTFMDQYSIQCGLHRGPQIRHRDNSYISHRGFISFAKEIAKKYDIPCQFAVRTSGGTNAGKIHLANKGIPCLVLGIPTRYAHTHYCYASYRDYKNTVKLATELIKNISVDIINSF